MRLIVLVVVGFALFAFTSCSKTQQPHGAHASNEAPSSSESDSLDTSSSHSAAGVHAEHDHGDGDGDGQGEHSHETASQHSSHGDAHTDHHAGTPTTANGKSPHGSHAHGHSARADSGREPAANDSTRIAIGDKVPDFEVTIDGEKFKFSELQKNKLITEDGTLVLTFWCSFCHSCRHVEHALDELAIHYKGKAGIIALDASEGETTEGVAEFAKQRELTLPIALDASGRAADIFGTRVTTTTVVIDKSGVLRYRGRFRDGEHAFASDALQAVLAGEDVPVQETRQKG